MNEDGTRNEGTTDAIAQLKGNFNNLYRAFEKMKELGAVRTASGQ